MKVKYLLNRIVIANCCVLIYFLVFISMTTLKIVSYNTPVSGMPCYLCFWGLYLVYFSLADTVHTKSEELIRYGSIRKYLFAQNIRSLIDNAIYSMIFSVYIFAYSYIRIGVFNIRTISIFTLTMLLVATFNSYILVAFKTFFAEKTMVILGILLILMSAVPELSFFLSVRLNLANNYFVKPLMLITKSQNRLDSLVDTIIIIAAWSLIATVILCVIKKCRKTVYYR